MAILATARPPQLHFENVTLFVKGSAVLIRRRGLKRNRMVADWA